MRKFIAIACIAFVLPLVACSNKGVLEDNTTTKIEQNQNQKENKAEDNIQIPSPFIECKTMEDAKTLAGFELIAPESILDGYNQSAIYAVQDDMVEVFYEKDESKILIRKGNKSNDISGDYNVYNENNTITVGDLQVTTKGNDGKINVATWEKDDFSYSISFDEEGVDGNIISDIISSIY